MDRGRDGGSLGLDLWVGLPSSEEHRVGRAGKVEAPEPSGALRARPKRSVTAAYADPDSLTRRAFAAIGPTPDHNDPAFHAAALPAANGIATADGLARFYASLVGPVDGVRLLAPDTVGAPRRGVGGPRPGPDRRHPLRARLHAARQRPPLLAPGSFGHPGRGGSLGFADPESGVAFGYVTNGFRRTVTADPRAQALIRAVRECVTAS